MASQGDPRVLLVMNLVLSALFAWLVVSGLAFATGLEYSLTTVALATGVLMILTGLITFR